MSYFCFFYQPPSSSLYTVFGAILSNIDEILSINPSAFVCGGFNDHCKDWLKYSGGTDRPGELCYNFSISPDFTQSINFINQIPDCSSQSSALLDLFLLMLVFVPPLGNSGHVVVSVCIDFTSNSTPDGLFHCIVYDYSRADWDGLLGNLRDVP